MKAILRTVCALLFMGVILFMGSGQTGLEPSWDAAPLPTANLAVEPDKVRPQGVVYCMARNVQDYDTKTSLVLRGTACAEVETLELDGNSGSHWIILDTGAPEPLYKFGLDVYVEVEPWTYPTQGEGDYRSWARTYAKFIFHDGRAPNDPRYDCEDLGGGNSIKVIPDTVTTALGDPFITLGMHIGHSFNHSLYNMTHTFSFAGLEVGEEILAVYGDSSSATDAELQELQAEATGRWTITADNNFQWCDEQGQNCHNSDHHGAGGAISAMFDRGNSVVTVWQVYKIMNWGWPEKNPDHAIGKRPSFLALDHIQIIQFQYINPRLIRVNKNGVQCTCQTPP